MSNQTRALTIDRRRLLGGTTLAAASALATGVPVQVAQAQRTPAPLMPSPSWRLAMPPGPDASVKITEAYARMVARDAYFWAWPMVNIYNRRLAFKQAPEPGLMNGVLPFAPLNTLSMLHDYVEPEQRWVACPNQDVVYGAGIAALDETPVVVQVPDFRGRFWVYQVVDLRTDSFAQLGAMYATQPGFYLLASPDWNGEVPKGITKVFRAKTGTAFVVPRVFMDDTLEDRQAIQAVIGTIDIYPLAKFDGTMKQHDWRKLPKLASPTGDSGAGETKWVFPDKFFDELPAVLKDGPPLPGEEARYAQVLALVAAAQKDPALKQAMIDEATKAEKDLVDPLLQFRNWGVQLANNWSSRPTTPLSAPTISPAPRSPNRTSWSTRRMKRSTSTKTSTAEAHGSTAPTPTRPPSPRIRRRRSMGSGRSRSTTRSISSSRTRLSATRSAPRTGR
jgi:hypothetical protein